jgi:hypothetical protein
MFNNDLERQACRASGQVGRVEEAKAQREGRHNSGSIAFFCALLISMESVEGPKWVLLVFLQQLFLFEVCSLKTDSRVSAIPSTRSRAFRQWRNRISQSTSRSKRRWSCQKPRTIQQLQRMDMTFSRIRLRSLGSRDSGATSSKSNSRGCTSLRHKHTLRFSVECTKLSGTISHVFSGRSETQPRQGRPTNEPVRLQRAITAAIRKLFSSLLCSGWSRELVCKAGRRSNLDETDEQERLSTNEKES